jgi:hypothetical protein
MFLRIVRGENDFLEFVPYDDHAGPWLSARVNIVFTDPRGTAAALRLAAGLAGDLDFGLGIVVAELIPYPLPLDCPPVPLRFRISQLLDLTRRSGVQAEVQLQLCRNPLETLKRLLPLQSPVVIGVRNTWHPTRARRLANNLQRMGYQVVVAPHS